MKTCLIVDDSSSIRKVAKRILQDLDIRSTEAETRREALELCREEMPDCIVADWHMQDGDVMEFMAKVRNMPGGKDTTILYLTSERDPMNIARAMRSGADAHMMKPFDRDSLTRSFAEAGLC